jgi:hypothetical protein
MINEISNIPALSHLQGSKIQFFTTRTVPLRAGLSRKYFFVRDSFVVENIIFFRFSVNLLNFTNQQSDPLKTVPYYTLLSYRLNEEIRENISHKQTCKFV